MTTKWHLLQVAAFGIIFWWLSGFSINNCFGQEKVWGSWPKEVSDTIVEGQEDNLQQCGSAVQVWAITPELEPRGQAFMGVWVLLTPFDVSFPGCQWNAKVNCGTVKAKHVKATTELYKAIFFNNDISKDLPLPVCRFLQESISKFLGYLNMGCLKWWYPTTMRFPTRNDHFWVFNLSL